MLCVRRQATWAAETASPGSPFSGTRDPADTTTLMGQREHFAKRIFS